MLTGGMGSFRIRFEPAITAAFRQYWRMSRGLTLGVRGVATDAEGRVLLVRHTYRTGWYLPGGGVERRETAEDAAKREMEEEAGVRATAPLKLFGFYSNERHHPGDHVALYLFPEWAPCPTASDQEIAERGFFELSALPEGVTPGTRRRLAEVFEGAAIDAHW